MSKSKKYRYKIIISDHDIAEAFEWCQENFGGNVLSSSWDYDSNSGELLFEHEADAAACRLRFDEAETIRIIDPPMGWQYGFPKRCVEYKNKTLEEWMIEQGYPKKAIDDGMLDYCRYWVREIRKKD